MANNSNFSSNFSNTTSYIDILSSRSDSINILVTSQSGGTTTTYTNYYARYFYLGNLLIQFSDIANGIPTEIPKQATATIYFPISFSGKPYCVMLTSGQSDGGGNSPATLNTINNNRFTCNIGNNDASILFFAIGPR